MSRPLNFLCVSTYFKGEAFLRACKVSGNNVYLLTVPKLRESGWPREYIDGFFYMEVDESGRWNREHVINGLAFQYRSIKFDRFVALDDFDVEKVAFLREYFRVPGMGETTARYFRDKLAMRMKALEAGINVPRFTALFHDQDIHEFLDSVPAPWLVKPRGEASATGIKKFYHKHEVWDLLNFLGDRRHQFLIESFRPGNVYHADALSFDGHVRFCRVSHYLDTPLDVAHGGGIFRSHTIPGGREDEKIIKSMTLDIMKAFGMQYSASHTEFIKANDDGKYYFLETSSRVGGANLAEMVEAASGVNLWEEWARLETAKAWGAGYTAPNDKGLHAGIVVSLSRFEHPDTSSFSDPEIVWRMKKPWHIGLIVQSDSRERILELLDHYTRKISEGFHASAPVPDRPAD